jgi:hypothetical protein
MIGSVGLNTQRCLFFSPYEHSLYLRSITCHKKIQSKLQSYEEDATGTIL